MTSILFNFVTLAVIGQIVCIDFTNITDDPKIQFSIFNNKNPSGGPVVPENLNPKSKNFIISHAFLEDSLHPWVLELKQTYLKNYPNCNVLIVDYGYYSHQDYLTAVSAVPKVGKLLAKAVYNLGDNVDIEECVGFSLGAHVCGTAGHNLPGRFKRIIGIDAAGPGFDRLLDLGLHSLKSGDADVVIGYYSSGSLMGFGCLVSTSYADYNIVINNGFSQPGCNLLILDFNWLNFNEWFEHVFCSHTFPRPIVLSILKGTGSYEATSCDSYFNYKLGLCNSNEKLRLNQKTKWNTTRTKGVYYLQTDKYGKPA